MSLSNFELGKQLGKGSFGSVCIVTRKQDRKIYAMKRVNLSNSPKNEIEAALNEIRLLYSLNHPNIIGYKEAIYDAPSLTLNIVMEFADGGDLLKKIEYNKKNHLRFDENIIWEWIIQLLNGVLYLHTNHIMHRDLKSANIFLMKNGVLKIGDLNVSKLSKNSYARTKTGTPFYLAPEVWEDRPYDYKCDIWSLGCIIYELCALTPPFRGTNFKDLYNNIKNGYYIPISSDYSNDLKQIISKMLITNPNKRLSANDLINCEIIQNRIKNNPKKDNIKKISLIGTIKMPRNLKDIGRVLPHERYQMGENDPYETMKKTIKLMGNKNEDSKNNNNVNIQPLNNYNRDLANQRKYNFNNIPNNNNLINNNQKDVHIKPKIISDESKNNKNEYNIFNKNNNNINNNVSKNNNNLINNFPNNQRIPVKEIKSNKNTNGSNSSKSKINNEPNKSNGMSTKQRKEQKEKFELIKNEFKNNRLPSGRVNRNQRQHQQQKPNGNEGKNRRPPSGQPKNIYNNNNPNHKNANYNNYNNMNNNYNNNYGVNKNYNNNANNNMNNNMNNNRNKRPYSHLNNRVVVNNNVQKNNYINNNRPIRKYEIKNHNYNYNGHNFDMRPYKGQNKANYGKLDVKQYKENNRQKFNNYLNNGGRVKNNNNYNYNYNEYNRQMKAHRQRVNPAQRHNDYCKNNMIQRDGKFRK